MRRSTMNRKHSGIATRLPSEGDLLGLLLDVVRFSEACLRWGDWSDWTAYEADAAKAVESLASKIRGTLGSHEFVAPSGWEPKVFVHFSRLRAFYRDTVPETITGEPPDDINFVAVVATLMVNRVAEAAGLIAAYSAAVPQTLGTPLGEAMEICATAGLPLALPAPADAHPATTGDDRGGIKAAPKGDVEDRAMLALTRRAKEGLPITVASIARDVGCSPSYLYRRKRFMELLQLSRRPRVPLPRGRKDRDTGELEAWEED